MVDDHDLVRQGLRLLLEGEDGWSVVGECSRAGECLPALARLAPDLLLLDLNLPDGAGQQLARESRAQHPQIPVLVLTTFDDIPSVLGAMRAGANGYLVKSARRDELISAVRTVAEGGCYLHPRIAHAVLGELHHGAVATTPVPLQLSPRESHLLRCLASGMVNPEIARELHVSVGTVKQVLSQLFQKLGVRDRTQLAAEAARRGLDEPPRG